MALSLENALAVKQQATSYASLPVGAQMELKAFFMHHAQHNKNKKLDFVAFTDVTTDTGITDAACKVYFIYAKKQATATDAFFKVFDYTDDTSNTYARICLPMLVASEYSTFVAPAGFNFATEVTIASMTTFAGTHGSTETTSGDGPNGFFIIGNP
jgi:hypothetical protein